MYIVNESLTCWKQYLNTCLMDYTTRCKRFLQQEIRNKESNYEKNF